MIGSKTEHISSPVGIRGLKGHNGSATKGRVLALLLAVILCLSGMPAYSKDALAVSNNDVTDRVETKIVYQALGEDGSWIEVEGDDALPNIGQGSLVYRAVIEWVMNDDQTLGNNDYFTADLDEGLKKLDLKAQFFDNEENLIGTTEVNEDGTVKVVADKLDESTASEDVSSGQIEFFLDDGTSEPDESDVPSDDASGSDEKDANEDEAASDDDDTEADAETDDNATLDDAKVEPWSGSIGVLGGGPTGDPNDAGSFGQISLVKFVKLANGCMGGIALDTSGRVWTFGYNLYGDLGIGKTNSQQSYYGGMKRIPYFISSNIEIVEIGATYETRFALSSDGKVYAWGHGAAGEMGNGSTTSANNTPAQVTGLPEIAHIFSSDSYLGNGACFALATDGTLWAWGYNTYGQLGLGNTTSQSTPKKVPLDSGFTSGARKIVKVSLGRTSAHLVDDQGDLWTTGNDAYGQQGNGAGTVNYTSFTKMDRSSFGNAKIIDVDTSYVALQNISDRVVAADENGNAWEWGSTYGDGGAANTRIEKHTPQKITLSSSATAAYGYTPLATSVTSSEMVGTFIDQHGRPWSWGSGYYFGFGREGHYGAAGGANTERISSTAAQQRPDIIGDGDTQYQSTDAKTPVYTGGTKLAGTTFGYGFNTLHPTIYDEKYMLRDDSGYVLDIEGNRIKYASATTVDGVGGLTRGMYYRVDGSGKVISPATTGTPALNPTDALWINLAFEKVPYIIDYDMSLSAYAFIDSDGNLFKWGNDGSGAIAWGWDWEQKYDGTAYASSSSTVGLADRYTYEVMYMRGAPTIDIVDLTANLKEWVKVYKDPDTGDVSNIAEIKLHIPKTVASAELESDVHSDVTELKYVFVPYDTSDPNFVVDNTAMTYTQFMTIYGAADDAHKGSLIDSTIYSTSDEQNLTYEVNVPENGRIIVWAVNDRYVDGPGGTKEYQNINNVNAAFVADNVYTPVSMNHKGVGVYPDDSEGELYAPTTDNVVKTNDDSADTKKPFDETLYGLPLDGNGNVIGATKNSDGSVTIDPSAMPRYQYDTTEIKSYEAVSDVGLPSGIKPYWKFKTYLDAANTQLQAQTVSKNMDDVDLLTTGYAHTFYYEQDSDYWTTIEGEKVWEDSNDQIGTRPSSISLTLKQYERNTSTGAQGTFIKDVETITVAPNAQSKWIFSFGSQMSYEYTYRIVETAIPGYTTEIAYPNLVIGGTTNEDLSGVVVTNTLNLKPAKFFKVDASNNPITADTAQFELKNATAGGKVLDASGVEQNSIQLTTTSTDPFIIMPIQKPGNYLLTETKAPSGFNLLTMDIEITVDSSGQVTAHLGAIDLDKVTLTGADAGIYAAAFNIVNKTAADLPQAGGTGTFFWLALSGTVLFVAAFYLRKRNRDARKEGGAMS